MEENQLGKIVVPLLEWYRGHSRCLPWRMDKEAYHVWVSEIMLQQTRVEAVIPYYERFMKRFPSIESLAASEDEELYKLWEGLGYYTRVRNLKKAAQVICERYQGRFPEEYEQILALPGIGAYTAGAVSSIAFEQVRAAVDGNVLRVITRLTQDETDITDAKFRNRITQELEKIYPQSGRGDFTQSLMELGAVVCVPNGEPRCGECPLQFLCGANHSGTQLKYPVKAKKTARKVEHKTVLILICQDRTALRKREDKGILSGMWELPNIDGALGEEQIREWLLERSFVVNKIQAPACDKRQLKHIFTHVEWHMTCWIVICENEGSDNSLTWVTAAQLDQEIALPSAFKKVYREYF